MAGGQGLNPQGLGGSENVGSSESKTSTTDSTTTDFPVAGWDGRTRQGYDSIQAALDDGNKEIELLDDEIDEQGITFDLAFSLTDTLKIRSVGKRTLVDKTADDSTPILDMTTTNASSRLVLERIQFGDSNNPLGSAPAIDGRFWQTNDNRAHRWELQSVRSRYPVILHGADEMRIQNCAFISDTSTTLDYAGNTYTTGAGLWGARWNNSYIIGGDFGTNASSNDDYGVRLSDCNELSIEGNPDGKNSNNSGNALAEWRFEGVQGATITGISAGGPSAAGASDMEFGTGPDTTQACKSIYMFNPQIDDKITLTDIQGLYIFGETGGPWTVDAQVCQDVRVEASVGPVSVTGGASDNVFVEPGFKQRVGPDAGSHREFRGGLTVADGSEEKFRASQDEVVTTESAPLKLPTYAADPGSGTLDEGKTTIYVSDGSAGVTGDDGDVILAVNSGGTVKTTTLADFSAL